MKKINTSNSLIFGTKIEDVKKSLEYLDQGGYFSNRKDFSEYKEGELDEVRVGNAANFVFYAYMRDDIRYSFRYFIPKTKAVFVEEEPKKKTLRAFKSLEEFFNVTGFKVGDIVQIKKFGTLNYYETGILTCTRLYIDEKIQRIEIFFGSNARPLSELFKHYMYFKNGEWVHFGVEE